MMVVVVVVPETAATVVVVKEQELKERIAVECKVLIHIQIKRPHY